MTRLSIDLPEDVKARLEVRAARSGHANVEEFVQALLRAESETSYDDDDGEAGPQHLAYQTEEQLEALLLRRVEDPRAGIEATPEFWAEFQRRVEARRRQGA
jgi:plasmid stability protein